ncbi:MAG: D-alanine--D-alanine ligase family protein [Anaerolineales bacterium]
MTEQHKLRVGVIFGGRSGEHEVSLVSAASVLRTLDPLRYDLIQIGIDLQGRWWSGADVLGALRAGDTRALQPVAVLPDPTRPGLYAVQPDGSLAFLQAIDVFFPLVHGTFGEDGTLQGLLELNGAPYVGAGVVGSAVGMDKAIFKAVMAAHNLPLLPWHLVLRTDVLRDPQTTLAQLEDLGSYPLFVKPANLGSSVGITKCRNRSDLYEGLMEAARFDRRLIVERGVEAREIEVSVLGNEAPQASLPGEIRLQAEFYSYEAKYHDDRSELLIPAPLSPEMSERVRLLAVQAYRAADCAGMARADFLLDKQTNELYLNEINTIPGFTQISMYPKLWEASGLPYRELLNRLIELALARQQERLQTRYQRM